MSPYETVHSASLIAGALIHPVSPSTSVFMSNIQANYLYYLLSFHHRIFKFVHLISSCLRFIFFQTCACCVPNTEGKNPFIHNTYIFIMKMISLCMKINWLYSYPNAKTLFFSLQCDFPTYQFHRFHDAVNLMVSHFVRIAICQLVVYILFFFCTSHSVAFFLFICFPNILFVCNSAVLTLLWL